jgi:hypothetical protein
MTNEAVEPWLRGPIAGLHPVLAATVHAFMQVREDLVHWTEGLSTAQIWARPFGLAPVGFQLRHIAGSVERLTTYLRGHPLSDQQLEAARSEMEGGLDRTDLLALVNRSLQESERVIRTLDVALLSASRTVGRSHLPTTVAGLVIHLAEHTQRHVGELIITSKLAKTA